MKSSSFSTALTAVLFVVMVALTGCSADSFTGPEAEVPTDETVQTETQNCDPCNTDPPDGHNTSEDDN